MKKLIIIITLIIAIGALGLMLFKKPEVTEEQLKQTQNILTPWDIQVFEDGTSKILGIHLGKTTLQTAIDAMDIPESMALFAMDMEPTSLEVYFKHAPTGPLKAQLITTLDVSVAEMKAMMMRATSYTVLADGTKKFFISEEDKRSLSQSIIISATLIPAYKGLEAEYFRERLGEPEKTVEVSPTATAWLYPSKGLNLLIDEKGNEVFQYQTPKSFPK